MAGAERSMGGTGMRGLLNNLHSKFQHHQIHKKHEKIMEHLAAEIVFSSAGVPKRVELFGEYVSRQIGLSRDSPVAKRLGEVAIAYLSGDKTSSDVSLEGIFVFLSKFASRSLSDEELGKLNKELVRELDVCIISYFAFHWRHAAHILDQLQDGERKLKSIVMAATRKDRFEKIMSTFKTKRAFSTLLETLKAMHLGRRDVPREGDVVVPADSKLRSPVLLLIGGGMGAGKSTVVKEILTGSFWSAVAQDAVVVEADAFKETDVIYRTISSRHENGDIAFASELVHSSSTRAASSLLVSALNEGRDVIFDGTMMWEPFVLQTIAMARDVHNRRYRLGQGYVQSEDGSVVEEYWVPVEDDDDEQPVDQTTTESTTRRPYRVELVGVISDPLLAVVRGIRRAIITKRAVPIRGQLRSHRLFAASLEKYCELVDNARVYSTSRMGEAAEMIGWKDGASNCKRLLVDPEMFGSVRDVSRLNEKAGDVFELFEDSHECDVWKEVVMNPERVPRQEYLKRMLSVDGRR